MRKSWGRDFRTYTGNNVDASQQLLEACVGRPLRRFVYASSSSLYGDNVQIPMRESALPQPVPHTASRSWPPSSSVILFRESRGADDVTALLTVYGPRQRPDMAFHRFIRASLDGQPITVYGDGEQTRDFTLWPTPSPQPSRRETRACRGGAYNVGGGSRVSMNRVIDIIGRIAGRPLDVRPEPTQKGDMRDTHADTSLARADLGFSPSVTLEQGIEGVSMAFSTTRARMSVARYLLFCHF